MGAFPHCGTLVRAPITTKNKKTDEARAWIMKYFREASVVKMFSCADMRGINDI
jgi:hypothetical protein